MDITEIIIIFATNLDLHFMSVKDRLQALDILKGYNGQNPYILMLKRDVLTKNIDLTDFNVEYVLKNHTFQPKQINKTINIK